MPGLDATIPLPAPGGGAACAPRHRADPYFFGFLIAFLWAGLLLGFIPEIVNHVAQNKPAYPWIVHVHGFVFVSWMLLLTTQFALVRLGRVAVHRRVGTVAYYWAPAMVVVGLVTSVVVDRNHFGTPDWDPQFLAIQLADLVNFAILVAFALRMRGDLAAHKRLMLLAVVALGNAGFSRWWGDGLAKLLGEGPGALYAELYLGDLLIVAAMLAYDLVTRMRVHPVLLAGGGLLLGVEVLSVWLYLNPSWIAWTDSLLRP